MAQSTIEKIKLNDFKKYLGFSNEVSSIECGYQCKEDRKGCRVREEEKAGI
jgi:hypothetical protein